MAKAAAVVPARLTLNIECPECGSREAHLDLSFPMQIEQEMFNRDKAMAVVRWRIAVGERVPVEIKCASEECGRNVVFRQVSVLPADAEALDELLDRYLSESNEEKN